MSKHVLVVMDRAEASDRALEYAFEEYPEATVSVVHVTETGDSFGFLRNRDPEEYMVVDCDSEFDDESLRDPNSFSRVQRKRAEQVIERACELSNRHGREIDPVVRSGDAVSEIVACANDRGVDVIVVAEHPRTALRSLLRAVPESVARNTSLPVTIV